MKILNGIGVLLVLSLASCATFASVLGAASKEEMAAAKKEIAALQEENRALKESLAGVTTLGVEVAEVKSVQEQLLKRSNAVPKETLQLMLDILSKALKEAPAAAPTP